MEGRAPGCNPVACNSIVGSIPTAPTNLEVDQMESIGFRFIASLMRLLRRERFEIGRKTDVYLTRWNLFGKKGKGQRRLLLHYFHRSDYDGALHDHPWPFTSLIIWPGYWEWTSEGARWYGPLSILRRPADWAHRVELDNNGKSKCWTIVLTGTKNREWGFFCPKGWRHWREFEKQEELHGEGCGED